MKRQLFKLAIPTSAALAVLNLATLSFGQSSPATGKEELPGLKTFGGTITKLDTGEKTLAVRTFWRTRTFNIADKCTVTFEAKPLATLADLHRGEKVEVFYENNNGVLIAHRILQEDMALQGRIALLDESGRRLSVKHGVLTRDFTLDSNCVVKIHGELGSLNDLKLGHLVRVVYEPDGDSKIARRIEQEGEEFVGTVSAIDTETRTVKAESMFDDKKFSLTDDCQIVMPGRPEARLRNLRIGDRVSFSYEDKDGVLVVNRIGLEESAAGKKSQDVQVSEGHPASASY